MPQQASARTSHVGPFLNPAARVQLADEESANSLMLRVNAALARAKRAGRNCVEPAMQ